MNELVKVAFCVSLDLAWCFAFTKTYCTSILARFFNSLSGSFPNYWKIKSPNIRSGLCAVSLTSISLMCFSFCKNLFETNSMIFLVLSKVFDLIRLHTDVPTTFPKWKSLFSLKTNI